MRIRPAMRTPVSRSLIAGLVLTAMAAGTLHVSAAVASKKPTTTKNSTKSSGSKTAATHSSNTKSTTKGKSSKSSGKKSKRVAGQAAPTPERINEIQDALAKRGAYTGIPTGKWDDSTVDAMKKFQATNHLTPTGKLDAPTLQKLGLGSETAGLGAPTPPPNSVANRLLSPSAKRDAEQNETAPE